MGIAFTKKNISQGFKTIKSIKSSGPSEGFMRGAGEQHGVPFRGSKASGPRPAFKIVNDKNIADANEKRKPRHPKRKGGK